MRPIFCTECGREHGSGAGDDRWHVFMTLSSGVEVLPFDPAVADFTDYFACGDAHASLMFARWLATRNLRKPVAELPPYPGERFRAFHSSECQKG
jgi:hypothetical protein